MDHHNQIPPDLLIALDACRADSSDRQLPEVADALAHHPAPLVDRARSRLERADRAIAAAMQRTPVPEGLAERILANLAHHPPTASLRPAAVCTADDCATTDRTPTSPRHKIFRLRRAPRYKFVAGAAAAVAAAVLVALAFRPAREIDLASADQLAREFYGSDDHDAELSTTAAPAEFPLDARLASARGWRYVAGGFLGCPAVAYEMASRRGGARATLYVVSARRLKVPGAGPVSRAPVSTGGLTVGVWQGGGQVYVLVVEGGEREFQSFFAQSSGFA